MQSVETVKARNFTQSRCLPACFAYILPEGEKSTFYFNPN